MADEVKLHKNESIKAASRQLRGTLAEELHSDAQGFGADSEQLIKFHGFYQQEDRDQRYQKNPDGTPVARQTSFMVRSRIPGGRLTAGQFLAELELGDKFGNGTLRVTTRQALQLHGVLKSSLRDTIHQINEIKLSTLAACGDVNRNVMCCPAPYKHNGVFDELQRFAEELADHFRPKTTAYWELWVRDEEGEHQPVASCEPVDEPIYGATYLPRKFKMAVALPDDNCVDVLANDMGYLAIVEQGRIVGYNVVVGGGMGMSPSVKKTFPALAKPLAFVTPDQAIAVGEAVVKVQRDNGNRTDRKQARLKYVIAQWGIEKFAREVEKYYGQPLTPPRPLEITGVDDHIGWHEQGDGRLFLGINIENGRIKDEGKLRIKTGLRTIVQKFQMPIRLTALQAVLLCDVEPRDRPEIDRLLKEHGILAAEELTLLRRYSAACPAWPTCGLAITESERALPGVLDALEVELSRLGLVGERISVHMTGCPNGCARPYTPDIGFVGRGAGEKYTVYLGGNALGTRLAFVYRDYVPKAEIVPVLSPVLTRFREERRPGEALGDYCARVGAASLGATGTGPDAT